jgi:uncharacterized iron-regulated protein
MRYLLFFWTISFSCILWAQDNYKIYNKQGKEVSYEKLLKATNEKTHIFFGEYHDCATIHWLQLQMTRFLAEKNPTNLVVGFEMFESDNQLIIDEYMNGLISTKNFEDECRLWTNYKTDYKPIVEFLKSQKIPMIATNIPRRYANAVFYKGLEHLQLFSQSAMLLFPPMPIAIDTTLESNKQLMKMAMGGHSGKNMMEAQAVKDATMAYFIEKNRADKVFLHLNGSFHSNRSEGILAYLPHDVKSENILIISMVAQDSINKLAAENIGLADFIFCFPNDYARSH